MTPDAAGPRVVIVGGFMTSPPNYWPLRWRLLARGASAVEIAPLGMLDWLFAGGLGIGRMLELTGRTIEGAHRRAGGRPVIVIGHSGGGIIARLAFAPDAYRGRRGASSEHVGALVTLGTPHTMGTMRVRIPHAGHHAARWLDAVVPGAHFAPRTAYLTVGSRYLRARPVSRLRRYERFLALGHRALVGWTEDGAVGDGMVPADSVHLVGAEQLTFDDVAHGHIGRGWYGDRRIVDRWWPVAIRLWEEALAARTAGGPAPAATLDVPTEPEPLEVAASGEPRETAESTP